MEKKAKFWKILAMTARVLGMICGGVTFFGLIALCTSLFLCMIGKASWTVFVLIFAGAGVSGNLMFAFVGLMDCCEKRTEKIAEAS